MMFKFKLKEPFTYFNALLMAFLGLVIGILGFVGAAFTALIPVVFHGELYRVAFESHIPAWSLVFSAVGFISFGWSTFDMYMNNLNLADMDYIKDEIKKHGKPVSKKGIEIHEYLESRFGDKS